jgi:hypothetical protein
LNACGDDGRDVGRNGGIDRDVEARLTISQGVYGQTTLWDDVDNPRNPPVEYFPMDISVSHADEAGPAIAAVKSDEVGFYEIYLDPGAYKLCTSSDHCTQFRLDSGDCARLDYEYDSSMHTNGWAEAKTTPCSN